MLHLQSENQIIDRMAGLAALKSNTFLLYRLLHRLQEKKNKLFKNTKSLNSKSNLSYKTILYLSVSFQLILISSTNEFDEVLGYTAGSSQKYRPPGPPGLAGPAKRTVPLAGPLGWPWLNLLVTYYRIARSQDFVHTAHRRVVRRFFQKLGVGLHLFRNL